MCQNTQRPNLCAHNPQWHNPITQPVIGPFQSVQPGSGSVSHSQHGSLSGEWRPRLISHSIPLPASIVSTNQRSSSTTATPLCLSPDPSVLQPSLHPCRCHGHSFLSGQQKSLFSSLRGAVMTKLPIHLLRLWSSLPRLQNPVQLQSPHE